MANRLFVPRCDLFWLLIYGKKHWKWIHKNPVLNCTSNGFLSLVSITAVFFLINDRWFIAVKTIRIWTGTFEMEGSCFAQWREMSRERKHAQYHQNPPIYMGLMCWWPFWYFKNRRTKHYFKNYWKSLKLIAYNLSRRSANILFIPFPDNWMAKKNHSAFKSISFDDFNPFANK